MSMWSLIHPFSFAAHLQPFPLLSVLTAQQPTVNFFLHFTSTWFKPSSLFLWLLCSPPFRSVNIVMWSSALLCLHLCVLKVAAPYTSRSKFRKGLWPVQCLTQAHVWGCLLSSRIRSRCCQSSSVVKEDGNSFMWNLKFFPLFHNIFQICKERLRNW